MKLDDWGRDLQRWLFGPRNRIVSPEAERLLIKLAEMDGDPSLADKIKNKDIRVFVHTKGLALGWTERVDDDTIVVSLKSALMKKPASARTIFAAAHELQHTRQLSTGRVDPGIFNTECFQMESEANEVAARLVRASVGFPFFSLRRFKARRWCLSMEAAYPVVTQAFGGLLLWSLTSLLYYKVPWVNRSVDWLVERFYVTDKGAVTDSA